MEEAFIKLSREADKILTQIERRLDEEDVSAGELAAFSSALLNLWEVFEVRDKADCQEQIRRLGRIRAEIEAAQAAAVQIHHAYDSGRNRKEES